MYECRCAHIRHVRMSACALTHTMSHAQSEHDECQPVIAQAALGIREVCWMRIRRALTAAAAAAVIAPAAVLATPAAAFATEPAYEAGPRTSASPHSPDAATPADRPANSATSGGGTRNPDE